MHSDRQIHYQCLDFPGPSAHLNKEKIELEISFHSRRQFDIEIAFNEMPSRSIRTKLCVEIKKKKSHSFNNCSLHCMVTNFMKNRSIKFGTYVRGFDSFSLLSGFDNKTKTPRKKLNKNHFY